MKLLFVLFFSIPALITACTKDSTSTLPLNDRVDTATSTSRFMGSFVNGPYGNVSGMAGIYSGSNGLVLSLENLSSSNGPDLHVYLSREILPATFIDLGKLQSIAGNQVYSIPGNPDFNVYRYVLIHCQRYNHLFGSAQIN